MKKFAGYFLSPIALIVAALILVVFLPIQWLCYNIGGYKAHKVSVDIIHILLICTSFLLGNRVKFINKQNFPKERTMIFIANHQSLFDISPLSWLLRKYNTRFISKIELTRGIPSISYYLKVAGGANIDRDNPRQALKEIADFGIRMTKNHWSAIIFPEGTRSADGEMKPFQTAGIVTLLKKCPDALLVPVAINNSWRMSQYGLYPLSTFENISFEVLTPIEPAGRPVDELVQQIEKQIKEALPN